MGKYWVLNTTSVTDWFLSHFLVHVLLAAQPLLDGHSTHYNPLFIPKAAYKQALKFYLPPNTTHLIQPLDKEIFGLFKTYWNEECNM